MVSNTVIFTYIVFFICVCWKKTEFAYKLGITCNITAAIWLLNGFLNKWIWKTKYYNFLYKPTQKELSRDNYQKRKESPYLEISRHNVQIRKHHITLTKKEAYISNKLKHKSQSSTFLLKNKSLLPATSVLSQLPNPWPLRWTNSIVPTKIWSIFWSRNDSNYLLVKLSVQERWVQRLSPGPKHHKGRVILQPISMTNESVGPCSRKFWQRPKYVSIQITNMSKEIQQLKLVHKVVDVVDRPYRKICVTLLRYNVVKQQSSYAQIRLFARKREQEKFQHIVYVNRKLEEFTYLLDVMNSLW